MKKHDICILLLKNSEVCADTLMNGHWDVKIAEGGLNFYLALSFLFYFLFHFQSVFLFLELVLGLSDKDHTVT